MHSLAPAPSDPNPRRRFLYLTTLEHQALVANPRRKRLVMGHHDDHGASPGLLANHTLEKSDAVAIETRRRLVEKNEARGVRERPRERNALPLPARIGPHKTLRERTKPKARARCLKRDAYLDPVKTCRKLDVLPSREIAVAKRVMTKPAQLTADFVAPSTERPVRHGPAGRPTQRS
jgi:hypothetical protein